MYPPSEATISPDRVAYVMAATGETVTYGELEARSNQLAHLFRSLGLHRGDVVAVLLDNHPRYLEIAWAAKRAGLYYTCISSKLTAEECRYIIEDCGARLLVTSSAMGKVAQALGRQLKDTELFMVGEPALPYRSLEEARSRFPETPIADESAGSDMLYTSGTTGRPKGVKPPLAADGTPDQLSRLASVCQQRFGFGKECIYLCPAPLYHSAPLRFSMAVQRMGGTVVVMERFDAEAALGLIDRFRIECAQFVPTHFVRMLKLDEAVRRRYSLSSLRSVVHSSAPCPAPIKEAMIDWWGPIIHEYYSGTEGNGMCCISASEWIAHRGSVGRAVVGIVHVCDEQGEPLPCRSEGLVYFEGGQDVRYHGDTRKSADAYNRYGWSTLGDVGWMDEEGYLYLTDRKSFMIISGGVNIYPQEIENLLVTHPKVADCAVIGAPDDEMGEQVVAIVQPVEDAAPDPALGAELMGFAREHLSHVKAPRRIDFMTTLPRHPNGKLYKRLLRDHYWADRPKTAG